MVSLRHQEGLREGHFRPGKRTDKEGKHTKAREIPERISKGKQAPLHWEFRNEGGAFGVATRAVLLALTVLKPRRLWACDQGHTTK